MLEITLTTEGDGDPMEENIGRERVSGNNSQAFEVSPRLLGVGISPSSHTPLPATLIATTRRTSRRRTRCAPGAPVIDFALYNAIIFRTWKYGRDPYGGCSTAVAFRRLVNVTGDADWRS